MFICSLFSIKSLYLISNSAITQHGILGYAVLMNETFWNSLPIKIQHQLLDAMKETTDWQFEQAELMNEQDMDKAPLQNLCHQ